MTTIPRGGVLEAGKARAASFLPLSSERARAGRVPLGLALATALFLALALGTVRGVGVVGETTISWGLAQPPQVLVSLAPASSGEVVAGPLVAAQARPTERLQVGEAWVPLAVNAYTGGPPDWPARLAWALTGSLAAGTATHVGLGLLLLGLAHRFLRFHASAVAAGCAALFLATDWAFVFYRKVLGGTEVLLMAAGLLVLWSLWSRRWKGGIHGTVALAVGIGLGLLAKATFVATLAAFGVAALATRWDRPALKPPPRVHPGVLVGVVLLCLSPLIVANLHHALLPDGPRAMSHDTLALQLERLRWGWSGDAPAREGLANLLCFLGNPLAFFGPAYGATPVAPISTLRVLGFAAALWGVILEWRDRARSPGGALLRFLSIAVPLQVAFLFAANRDLHHLAQATVPLALLVGLAADRVAATMAPPRSLRRALLAGLLVAPHALAGARHLADTDDVLATVEAPTFTEAGQAALVDALRSAGVTRLVASDYELYGMLEARAPEIAVTHTWPALSRGERDHAAILRLARGGWYVSVRASAPMVYNWSPDAKKVARAAAEAGVAATLVSELGGPGKDAWATIWRVD